MEKTVAGKTINVNEEGFMTDFNQWTKEVGEELAKENDITLTPRHWDTINYIQDQVKKDVALSIRGIGKSGVLTIKELYELFPKAPLKTATKIAGVPKPASCI